MTSVYPSQRMPRRRATAIEGPFSGWIRLINVRLPECGKRRQSRTVSAASVA